MTGEKPKRAQSGRRTPKVPRLSGGAATRSMQRRVRQARDGSAGRYLLRLYVTGTSPASVRAIERVQTICEEHLRGRYDLEVIDIYQLPALAKDQQIVATPTLVKVLPEPLRRFIGDLSRAEKVLFGLDLQARR
ncbi:MAG TPA: circadian clock KaiB family protein [Anaeromyxobacteraceae bacterium]|nr:circadian clock KaiB family protein [Anaeromyxobacteraceae bacterium]